MCSGKKFALLVCVLFALVFALGCDSAEGTADSADGDSANPGPGEGGLGTVCTSQKDCAEGTECIAGGNGLICSMKCSSDAQCSGKLEGSCCKEVGPSFYCVTGSACGTAPNTDGDTGENTENTPEECKPDTYKCNGNKEIQRCDITKAWSKYYTCEGDTYCSDGQCVKGGSGQCDSSYTCCPDSFKCRGISEVQHCKSDGSGWELWRPCDAGSVCKDAECVSLNTTDGDVDMDFPEVEVDEYVIPVGDPCETDTGCDDSNEYCLLDDPTDKDSKEGHCRTYCTLAGGRCPRGYLCDTGTGECYVNPDYCKSDLDCPNTKFCDRFPTSPDGTCKTYCFEMGEQCPANNKCIEYDGDPNYGKCVPINTECVSCYYDGECKSGEYCEMPPGLTKGCCTLKCSTDNPCSGHDVCESDGRCRPGNVPLDCPGGCPTGHVCDTFYGVCAINCPPCGKDECCDVGSAPNCYTCECQNPLICGILLKPCCFGYSCSAIVYGVLGYCI